MSNIITLPNDTSLYNWSSYKDVWIDGTLYQRLPELRAHHWNDLVILWYFWQNMNQNVHTRSVRACTWHISSDDPYLTVIHSSFTKKQQFCLNCYGCIICLATLKKHFRLNCRITSQLLWKYWYQLFPTVTEAWIYLFVLPVQSSVHIKRALYASMLWRREPLQTGPYIDLESFKPCQ